MFYPDLVPTAVRYLEVQCKSALNRVHGMPFKWSLNPYRGCAHACHYCYARASHTYLGLDADSDFERQIFVKKNIAEVLRGELSRASWRHEQVALGTATDCYQPAEGRYRITRSLLEALRDARTPVGLVTKSPLVVRDVDVLVEITERASARVCLTITTLDEALSRQIEPGTASPSQRLRAVQKLRDSGIDVGVLLAPILPGITDGAASLTEVAQAAADHGAAFLSATALRLQPIVKEHYLDFVGSQFPLLLERYERAYPGAYAPEAYLAALERRLAEVFETAAPGLTCLARSRPGKMLSVAAGSTGPAQLPLPLLAEVSTRMVEASHWTIPARR